MDQNGVDRPYVLQSQKYTSILNNFKNIKNVINFNLQHTAL